MEHESGVNREAAPRTPEQIVRSYVAQAKPYWRQLIGIVVIGTLLVLGVAFVWPPTYTATTTLLPPSEEETGFNVSTLLRGISLPGVQIPTRTGPEDIAVAVLSSARIMSILVDAYDLVEVYDVKNKGYALRELAKRSHFDIDKNGTLVITVADREAQRAADLANSYAEELDRFNREFRMTKGRRTREFIETRLEETRRDMEIAEQDLRDYQAEHSAIALTSEQTSTVETGAGLFARQAALRVRIGVVRQYASENSEEVRLLRAELDQVNQEIASLPEIGLEMGRKLRELKIQEQVYGLLMAQYEEARIDEARDIPTLAVLDRAYPPDKRSWPRRGLLTVLGFAVSVVIAVVWGVLRIYWDRRIAA